MLSASKSINTMLLVAF